MENCISDSVEKHLIRLLKEGNGYIKINRTDIAFLMNTSPSHITYVLHTRFTVERGFLVETRRGINGFIKIWFEK